MVEAPQHLLDMVCNLVEEDRGVLLRVSPILVTVVELEGSLQMLERVVPALVQEEAAPLVQFQGRPLERREEKGRKV